MSSVQCPWISALPQIEHLAQGSRGMGETIDFWNRLLDVWDRDQLDQLPIRLVVLSMRTRLERTEKGVYRIRLW
jgi:hypothetical protein